MQKWMVQHTWHDGDTYRGSCPELEQYTSLYSAEEIFELYRKAKSSGNCTVEIKDDRIVFNFWDVKEGRYEVLDKEAYDLV